jgi:hypothetical protein
VRIFFFLAIVANSFDLVATALGIHWLGNREGNPLLANMAHNHWVLFVAVKGIFIPLLIVFLYWLRKVTPGLAKFGLAFVTIVLTVAVGQWLGWIAGVLRVASFAHL